MGFFSPNWKNLRKPKTEPPVLYTVVYDSENHWSILTQRLGSAWPEVMPFCILNVMFVIALYLIDPKGEKYSLSMEGHPFIKFVVAFLFVSRVTMALSRFNEARNFIGEMYKESRELVQNVCIMTAKFQDQKSKEWRAEVCRKGMYCVIDVLNFTTNNDLIQVDLFELDRSIIDPCFS